MKSVIFMTLYVVKIYTYIYIYIYILKHAFEMRTLTIEPPIFRLYT